MDLAGKRIVVTAGGTREPIDPVRYIGNRSSGKMGFALADAAKDRGADITLVTTIAPPEPGHYDIVHQVETLAGMREVVLDACKSTDVLIMAAAISDFRVANPADHKIKKGEGKLILELVENEDFLLELPDNFIKVGAVGQNIAQPGNVAQLKDAGNIGLPEIGVDQENTFAQVGNARCKIHGQGRLAVVGRRAGDQNGSHGFAIGGVKHSGGKIAYLFGEK